jgi:hypothetical protein
MPLPVVVRHAHGLWMSERPAGAFVTRLRPPLRVLALVWSLVPAA